MTSLNSPFLIGFEEIDRLLERIARSPGNSYPPYNIERLPEEGERPERLRITLAVAGFSADDIDVNVVDRQLSIRGRRSDSTERDYLHRGIAARQFQRNFVLASGMEVSGAHLRNGLLAITLVRPRRDNAVRRIEIVSRDDR